MLDVTYTSKFKKDMRRIARQGADIGKIDKVILFLREREPLPERLRDHELVGEYQGHRECHIAPDWLLIYRIDEDALMLIAVRSGSRSELFG